MDIENIREHYKRMSDGQLISRLTSNARGLRPEVFCIIEKEIEKRKLNPNLLKGALAQNKEYSLEEVELYSELFQGLPCPICGNTEERLNGTITYTAKSFLIITYTNTKRIIACPDCLDKKNNKAMIFTVVFGWWGIPWGIFKTPWYIYRNYKAKKENRLNVSNNTLLSFTLDNIGKIETYKNDKETLRRIIKHQNE